MDAIKNLLSRKSSKNLEAPFPSKKEMDIVYQSALRAPDHAWLRPSKFLEFKGESLEELSKIFTNFANDHYKEDKAFIEKAKAAPFRAPMVIVLITEIKDHPKVPAIEQMLSTSAATQNILLALHALGYGAIWKTGKLALNENIPEEIFTTIDTPDVIQEEEVTSDVSISEELQNQDTKSKYAKYLSSNYCQKCTFKCDIH